MKTQSKLVNIEYSLAQGGYWMSLCVVFSFAAAFLQARGYSNAQLGTVLAAGSTAAFFISPMLGGIVDRSDRISSAGMLWILLALHTLLAVSFSLLPGRSAAVSVCYALYIAVNTCLVPLLTQLCFDLQHKGHSVNFGVARGMGSLAFAAAAAVLGSLVEKFSSELLVGAGVILTVFQMLVLIPLTVKCRGSADVSVADGRREKSSSMLQFIAENRRFCILMLGIALMFFTHYLIDSFLINVVRNVGGGTKDMGNINAFMAVLELPAMFLYMRISRRIGCPRCVHIGVVFFAMKSVSIALASSLAGLYAAHVLQGVSYALIIPALVEYVDLYIPHKDSARGQAVSYAMMTLGSIFSEFLGGMMFDSLSVRSTLMIGAAVSVTGMTVCLLAAEKNAKRE